jgi:hypothetical protein
MIPTCTDWKASMRLRLMFVARPPVQPSAPKPPTPLHFPAVHVWPLEHARPQPPQLAAFVVVSTQLPAHAVCPAGHWHAPAWQLCPPAHGWSQPPQ